MNKIFKFFLGLFLIGLCSLTTYADEEKPKPVTKGSYTLITFTGEVKDEEYNGVNDIEAKVTTVFGKALEGEDGRECSGKSSVESSARGSGVISGKIFFKCYLERGEKYRISFYDNKGKLLQFFPVVAPSDREHLVIGRFSKDIPFSVYSKDKKVNLESKKYQEIIDLKRYYESLKTRDEVFKGESEYVDKVSKFIERGGVENQEFKIYCKDPWKALAEMKYTIYRYNIETNLKEVLQEGLIYNVMQTSKKYNEYQYGTIMDSYDREEIHYIEYMDGDKKVTYKNKWNQPATGRSFIIENCDSSNSVTRQEKRKPITVKESYDEQQKLIEKEKKEKEEQEENSSNVDTNTGNTEDSTIINPDKKKDEENIDNETGETGSIVGTKINVSLTSKEEGETYTIVVNDVFIKEDQDVRIQLGDSNKVRIVIISSKGEQIKVVEMTKDSISESQGKITIDVSTGHPWFILLIGLLAVIVVISLITFYSKIKNKERRE